MSPCGPMNAGVCMQDDVLDVDTSVLLSPVSERVTLRRVNMSMFLNDDDDTVLKSARFPRYF